MPPARRRPPMPLLLPAVPTRPLQPAKRKLQLLHRPMLHRRVPGDARRPQTSSSPLTKGRDSLPQVRAATSVATLLCAKTIERGRRAGASYCRMHIAARPLTRRVVC